MEEEQKIEEVVDNIKEHINTRYELVVLKASEKLSGIIAEIISGFLIVFVITLTVILLSFAAAYYLCIQQKDSYSGFIIIGSAYLLVGLLMIVFRKKLMSVPFQNKIIREFFKEDQPLKS